MKTDLTPILGMQAARARVGEMCEQVRADRDRRRHKPVWWSEGDDMAAGGCGGLAVAAVVFPGALATAAVVLWPLIF